MEPNAVSPKECREILTYAMMKNEPVMIWGSVGTAKTTTVVDTANAIFGKEYYEDEKYIYTIIGSLIQSYDLMGCPSVENGRTVWNPPIGTLLPPSNETRGGVIFIDEIMNSEDENVRQALMGLVHDRQVGTYTLPPNYRIVMASNRAEDGTFAHTMSKAMGTRAMHLLMVTSADEWLSWAVANKIDPRTRAFIKGNRDALNQPDPKAKGNSFPCPRTWCKASKFNDIPTHLRLKVMTGYLGDKVGFQYNQFLETFAELPDLEAIARNPFAVPLPSRVDISFICVTVMADCADAMNAGAFLTYVCRMNEDFQLLFFREFSKQHPELSSLTEVVQWKIKNADLLR